MNKIPRTSQRVMSFDDADSVVDANDLLFVEHYISGHYRYAQSATLSRARAAIAAAEFGKRWLYVSGEE